MLHKRVRRIIGIRRNRQKIREENAITTPALTHRPRRQEKDDEKKFRMKRLNTNKRTLVVSRLSFPLPIISYTCVCVLYFIVLYCFVLFCIMRFFFLSQVLISNTILISFRRRIYGLILLFCWKSS